MQAVTLDDTMLVGATATEEGAREMSLGIAFKGPEGIVLAADSRVTLTASRQTGQVTETLPAYFDNATKLLRVKKQRYVGAITYGVGALGQPEPRTAHSYLPEFENELPEWEIERLSTEEFARRLGQFFLGRWNDAMPADYRGPNMMFLVGGYDEGEPYGRTYEVGIPSAPAPVERSPGAVFGVTWGGQTELADRLIQGFDRAVPVLAQRNLGLTDEQRDALQAELKGKLQAPIPFQFLPLQDCVDLSIFVIRATIEIQRWMIGVRGVGGAIDVATIDRIDGFKPIQRKEIKGESK
ncbi:hypothetical protein ACFLX9_03130 [Chloroflexota bacterium]